MKKIEKTVGEIAATIPQATRVFQNLGIDYCCGGGNRLPMRARQTGWMSTRCLELLARRR
jgi:iron-sulfur cluster repair protein YtfE (RIC family)